MRLFLSFNLFLRKFLYFVIVMSVSEGIGLRVSIDDSDGYKISLYRMSTNF